MAKFSIVDDSAYKTCPRCGATLFKDMETCYGCMFNFPASQEVMYEDYAHLGNEGGDDAFESRKKPAEHGATRRFFTEVKLGFWSKTPVFIGKEQVDAFLLGTGEENIELDGVGVSMFRSSEA